MERGMPPIDPAGVDHRSSPERKIALFRSLFRGREDVYPRRFESRTSGRSGYAPACGNEWVPGVCGKPRIKCAECPNSRFLAVTDGAIRGHLLGADERGKPFVMGVYPMLLDETCHFVVVDFDGPTWGADAVAYFNACVARDVPAALERSRSGNGGHVWIFFDGAVPAGLARRLGAMLLTAAMDERPDLGFRSYDRFFPSQDTLPRGGFGNLIALPLQHGPRRAGNSVFVDDELNTQRDQWAFLSGLGRVSPASAESVVDRAERRGRVLGVRAVVEDGPIYVGLPRGCLEEAEEMIQALGIGISTTDRRCVGQPLEVAFRGQLRADQEAAARALMAQDTGVLAAATAFGKTVVAAWLIARRGVNTLVVVHREQLLQQWVDRLAEFLDIGTDQIGRLSGRRKKLTGAVDVALMQSLVRKGEVDDRVADYGFVIVDECHHVPARSFELVVSRAKARYITGLTATIVRKDGHHPIICLHCGPIRHRADGRVPTVDQPFSRRVLVRPTGFRPSGDAEADPRAEFHRLCGQVIADETRNAAICRDVADCAAAARSPLVLTERVEHLETLAGRFADAGLEVVSLRGGMSPKALSSALARIGGAQGSQVVLATSRFVGEGFDEPHLDTLFLTMPVSWRGTVAQYVGRLHRLHEGKREVRVYDYADIDVPMLARMFEKRRRAYEAQGYAVELPASAIPGWPAGWSCQRTISGSNGSRQALAVSPAMAWMRAGPISFCDSSTRSLRTPTACGAPARLSCCGTCSARPRPVAGSDRTRSCRFRSANGATWKWISWTPMRAS